MKQGLLGAMGVLLTGAALAWGQAHTLPRGLSAQVSSPPTESTDDRTSTKEESVLITPPLEPRAAQVGSSPVQALTKPARTQAQPKGAGTPTKQDPALTGPPQVNVAAEPERRSPSLWFNADYLLWWIRPGPSTPLVVTGSKADPFPGALDQPGTRVLYGDRNIDYGSLSGMRFEGGCWLDCQQRLGIDAGFFLLQHGTSTFNAFSDAAGNPFIGRPFIDAGTGHENVYFSSISFGGVPLAGGVSITSETHVGGFDTNFLTNIWRSERSYLNLLWGYRSLKLRETLQISETISATAPGSGLVLENASVNPPSSLAILDSFQTYNRFNGGQLGAQFAWQRDRFSLGLLGKIGLGATHEQEQIQGFSSLITPGAPTLTVPGGVLALSSNIGRRSHDEFAVVPEVGINLAYQITPWLATRAGYSFIYWSRVIRPGAQIDRTINTNLVPTDVNFGTPGGPNRPAGQLNQSDFWMHGVNFGVEVRY